MISDKLAELQQAVVSGKKDQAIALTEELLAANADPGEILYDGLIAGMNTIGEMFKSGECYVPEMLLAARAMQNGLERLRPKLVVAGIEPIGTVVIGTVQGDLHDIGKNLTAMFLEGVGFKVVDLGVNVSAQKFIDAVQAHHAQVLGMSALLTTTMTYTAEVINASRQPTCAIR
jgi:5-methyltetrahydrofolate--homocysteine methyltransferase